ncbi:hypothetical protein RJI07_05985 [Mycoplasmatota bacterium WC30]
MKKPKTRRILILDYISFVVIIFFLIALALFIIEGIRLSRGIYSTFFRTLFFSWILLIPYIRVRRVNHLYSSGVKIKGRIQRVLLRGNVYVSYSFKGVEYTKIIYVHPLVILFKKLGFKREDQVSILIDEYRPNRAIIRKVYEL